MNACSPLSSQNSIKGLYNVVCSSRARAMKLIISPLFNSKSLKEVKEERAQQVLEAELQLFASFLIHKTGSGIFEYFHTQ